MNKGRKGKAGGAGGFIVFILIMLATKDIWAGLLGGIALIAGSSAIFLGFLALIIFLITRISKSNRNYQEVQRRTAEAKANKNPYSVNYSQEAVDKEAKERAEKFASVNKKEVVIDGSTVKETPVTEKKEEPKHKTTGDPEIDKMIVEKDLAIDEMKRLDEAIVDEKLSEQIVHLEQVTEKMVNYVIEHPKKKKELNKFFTYYLPTILKLLNAYDRMDDAGISGTNIDGTKDNVVNMMETAIKAFDKQLDALYADEALDVSTDITVMENMLKAEGLTEDGITLKL